MAINLSDLTGAATSADILAEVQSTADFLDSVPLLKNLADPSGATDAKQFTATNQPTALPLIKNPSGDLGGYLYIPDVAGNYATGPSVTIGSNQTWEGEVDMVITQWGSYIMPMGGGNWASGFGVLFYSDERVNVLSKGGPSGYNDSGVTLGTAFNVKYGFDGTDIYVDIDGVRKFTETAPSQAASITHTLQLAQNNNLAHSGNYAIQKAKLTVNNAVVFDCDFNGSTSIRHGDTKFQAAVGGPVTINQSGNNPASIIKKPILRFDGVDDFMDGVFGQTITGGYMFAAFSVLGDGGEAYGRVFSVNPTGALDNVSTGAIFSIRHHPTQTTLSNYFNWSYKSQHTGLFDDTNGDILHESLIKDGTQLSRVNNADEQTSSEATNISPEEFNVGAGSDNRNNPAIDLEYLALFPATITDSQADAVRNYINNRNNVFDLKDGFGYYFFDPQSLPSGAVTSWNGRIVGSDNGDVDKLATQATAADQPTSDGYKVTFADATDHLEIPSTTQAGWQVVGTSKGTFVYKVNANAVTELTMLGNAGTYRAFGDLYGIMLLPESATNRDIEEARKLLIDRGASESVTGSSAESFWISRSDIVEFSSVDFSGVTNVRFGWNSCSAMTKFNVGSLPDATNVYNAFRSSGLTSFNTDLPLATRVDFAWYQCASLSSFTTTDIKNCTNFISAWQNCSSLTQFPQDAKLGTEASNVRFNRAWQQSGLTSFPSNIDLSTGNNFSSAWQSCPSLTSFPADAKLGTSAQNVNFTSAWQSSGLTSFPSNIDLSNGVTFVATWNDTNISSFPLLNLNNGRGFAFAWRDNNLLTHWPAGFFDNWNPSSITSGVFDVTWDGCTSLTAQSVENILTSIATSGKYATSTGASGGSALADATIDIDYNVATGSLTAATLTAIETLNGRGWSVNINGVIQ